MQSSDNDPLSLPLASKDAVALEDKLLVAATVAAVVLAGSAIAYRHLASNCGSRLFLKDSYGVEEKLGIEEKGQGAVDHDLVVGLPTGTTSTTSWPTGRELDHNTHPTGTTKSSRSKDRRKRGKDPLKEVLKSGKKLKSIPNPAGSSSTPSSPKLPAGNLSPGVFGEVKRVGENLELYSSLETGSSSIALQSQIMDLSQNYPESQQGPTNRSQREKSPSTLSTPSIHPSATGYSRDSSELSQAVHFKNDVEDDLAVNEDADYRQYAKTQFSSTVPPSPSSNLANTSELEVEGAGWAASVFKSRLKGTADAASKMSGFPESDDVSGAYPSTSIGEEDGETGFTFPTLNSQASTSLSGSTMTTSATSPSPSKKNQRFSSNKSGTPPPKAPSRKFLPNIRENYTANYVQGPNAGGGNSNMPALSAQTQLASLRGALEAARLREEKHKTEMERTTKEMEMLKLEATTNRRREAEAQAQVRHLTQQLESCATLFSTIAPHLNPQFAMQLPLFQPYSRANTEGNPHTDVTPDPSSSPKVHKGVELPDGDVNASASRTPEFEKLELQVAESSREEALPSSEKMQEKNLGPVSSTSPQIQQPSQQPLSPPANGVSSPLLGTQHPMSPPFGAFFPYTIPSQPPPQHPHFSVHHPWVYHQPQQSTNVPGVASLPSSPLPPQPYTNVYSPMLYPISPVASPLSPHSIGMTLHHLFHPHQPFGFGGDLRSPSNPPELTGSGTGFRKPRMRRRKSLMVNMSGNTRTGWEDIGDGWIGLGRVAMQPTTTNGDTGKSVADGGATANEEGEDKTVEISDSPYSEILADAILKRSSTIRPSKKNCDKEIVALDTQECAEEGESFTEFTFPSLANVGNIYYRTASRTESSISSSLSSSPPSTTATVPDLLEDPKWEEDRASVPQVFEKGEVLDPSVSDLMMRGAGLDVALSKLQDIVIHEDATSKKKEQEQSFVESLEDIVLPRDDAQ